MSNGLSSTSLYEILGLRADASAAAIKRAYRRASAKAHPDRAGGNADLQADVNKAYAILGDAQKRLHYDSTGETDDELTDEQQAANVMKVLFIKVFDHCIAHGLSDPIRLLREEIHKGLHEAPAMIATQRRKIAALEKGLAKQLKGSKLATPHLESALHAHIAQQTQLLAQMELAARIGPLMLEMLKSYTWNDDRYAQYVYTVHPLDSIFLRNPGG